MEPRAPAPLPGIALVEHVPDIRDWCLLRSGDPHLADDVSQETVLAALTRLHALREPDHLRGWMFRIAQRRLADEARRRRQSVAVSSQALDRDRAAPAPRDARQAARETARLLGQLPLSLRVPVKLHYLQGWSLREVAARLATTVNAVKARLYRARRLIREAVP